MAVQQLPSRLYVICDAEVCERAGWSLADFASACLDGGARFLQVRAKQMAGRDFLEATTLIVRLAEASGALIVVNDRADIARLAGAGGVHVGQEDLSPAAVRAVAGNVVIGLSTHTPGQMEAAVLQPITYVAVGPVFGTATKATGYEPIGVDRVREAAGRAAERHLPLVAIGGITLERAPALIDAGAQAVAVISDLLVTRDPAARVRRFLEALDSD